MILVVSDLFMNLQYQFAKNVKLGYSR